MDFNIKDNLVTYITKDGEIGSIGKNLNERHNDILISVLNKYDTNLNEYSNTLEIYKEVAKLGLLAFLNSGKEIIDGEEKYSFAILCPNELTKEQSKCLSMYVDLQDDYVNHTLLFKYNKENEKLENMMYEQKLSYGIDEIKELLKEKNDISQLVIDLFYTDIVPSIIKGKTTIDEVNYRVNYNVKINDNFVGEYNPDVPTLEIENVEEFNKYLVMYVNKHSMFLHESGFIKEDSFLRKDINEQIRYSLMNLFINATSNDFNNPIDYLKLRISFLEKDLLYERFDTYENVYNFDDIDCHIEVSVLKQHPANETPYAFFSKIVSNDGVSSFDLPKIRYGIKDNGFEKEVYIYAIQGNKKKNVLNTFEKKINRYLFKINKDVIKDDEYLQYEKETEMMLDSFYPENVIDVTHNSVLALSIFLKVVKELGINKVTVIDYLPIRYDGKLKGKYAVADLYKAIYSEEELSNKYTQAEEQMDTDQFNMTNKFIRTFNRVNYHLNNMGNITYPYEVDDKMHFIINDEVSVTDHLINNVYNGINIDNIKRK